MELREFEKKRERAQTMRRFSYYLIGVAIGCVLVGLLMSARAKMVRPGNSPAPSGWGGGSGASPTQGP